MSRIHREIGQCMSGLETENGQMTAKFLFPSEFVGFQGHFEKNPVLPGVCKIQAVLVMHEKMHGGNFRLKEVNQAKYFMPVSAGQEITVRCESKPVESGLFRVKAIVEKDSAKVAMLQVVIENAKL